METAVVSPAVSTRTRSESPVSIPALIANSGSRRYLVKSVEYQDQACMPTFEPISSDHPRLASYLFDWRDVIGSGGCGSRCGKARARNIVFM